LIVVLVFGVLAASMAFLASVLPGPISQVGYLITHDYFLYQY